MFNFPNMTIADPTCLIANEIECLYYERVITPFTYIYIIDALIDAVMLKANYKLNNLCFGPIIVPTFRL